MLCQFAKTYNTGGSITRDGLIHETHPDTLTNLRSFAHYLHKMRTPSQVGQLWAGAVNKSLREGTVSVTFLKNANPLVTMIRKTHIKTPRRILPIEQVGAYLARTSETIFGKFGSRKTLDEIDEGDLNHYFLMLLAVQLKIRPASLLFKKKVSDDKRNFLIIERDILEDVHQPGTMLVKRPMKTLRQKHSNKRVKVGEFLREFDPSETIVSVSQAYRIIQRKAKRDNKKLDSPLGADSPKGLVKNSVITARDHTIWRKGMASKVGLPDGIAKYFTCRTTRRSAITATAEANPNALITSALSGHRSPNTTAGYIAFSSTKRAQLQAESLMNIARQSSHYHLSVSTSCHESLRNNGHRVSQDPSFGKDSQPTSEKRAGQQ